IRTSDLISAALGQTNFTQKNHWNFHYSNVELESQLKLTNYFAWVVKEPPAWGGDGHRYGGGDENKDRGGAVFSFEYHPIGDDPINSPRKGDTIHFIQALSIRDSLRGTTTTELDIGRGTGVPTPFYDGIGAAGKIPGKNTWWFLDIPSDPCVVPC